MFEAREQRSFDLGYVHSLWHSGFVAPGFHEALGPSPTSMGGGTDPVLPGFLDDCSRVACHQQWSLQQDALGFVHDLCR